MADAYTTRGGLIKPEVGQDNNTWGDKLNNNAMDSVDKALFGFEPIVVTGDFSLTSVNGDATSTQLNKAIRLGGTPAADFACTWLSKEQLILVHNVSGRNATHKVSAGTGVTLANGQKAFLGYNATYGDVTLVSPTRFTGDLVSDGALTISGQIHGISAGAAGTDGINKNQLDAAIAGLTSVTSPGTAKVSSTDTTFKYLFPAFSITATGGILLVNNNIGGNETIDALLAINTMTAYTAPVDADAVAAYASGPAGHRKITAQNFLVAGWAAQTSADDADSLLIYDNSASILSKQTRANFIDTGQQALYDGVFSL